LYALFVSLVTSCCPSENVANGLVGSEEAGELYSLGFVVTTVSPIAETAQRRVGINEFARGGKRTFAELYLDSRRDSWHVLQMFQTPCRPNKAPEKPVFVDSMSSH
jgi:hypothetical protein